MREWVDCLSFLSMAIPGPYLKALALLYGKMCSHMTSTGLVLMESNGYIYLLGRERESPIIKSAV